MGDSTFSDLPYVGETGPDGRFDPDSSLALFVNTIRTEASNDRQDWVSVHPKCENLYLYGTEKIGEEHVFPKIQGMIDAFYALATSTAPAATVKMMTHLDGGIPLVDPIGMPYMDSLGQPFPLFDATALSDFIQRQLDYTLDKSRAVTTYNSVVKNTMIYGWQLVLKEWDEILDLPKFRIIPALQWYMTPTEEELANMPYLGLDWPIDAQDAKRMFPQVADKIDEVAQRSIYTQPGAVGYSGLYYGHQLARPMVTLSIWWIRNREMLMSDQEAIGQGAIESRMVDIPPETPAPATPPMDGQTSPLPTEPAPMSQREALFHMESGEEITKDHPDWPRKLVTSMSIQIQGDIVYDGECKDWDFPVIANYNVRVPNQPYGQSECIRVQTLQKDLNSVHASTVKHAGWFQGATIIADNRLQERLPNGTVRNMGMRPNVTHWFDSNGGQLKAKEMIEVIDPPAMPPALMEVKRDLVGSFNDAGENPAIQQGQSPTANSSGVLAQTLMSASTATASTKFKYLEEFWWRLCMLVMHDIREKRSPEQMYAIDRTYPVEAIRDIILPFWKSVEVSLTVEIAGGQSKAAKEMAVREDFANRIIDAETACDLLGYDFKLIQQRRQSAMVAGAVTGSMPGQTPPGTPTTDGSQAPADPGGSVPSTVPAPAESAVA
jgi:hypothetical protein